MEESENHDTIEHDHVRDKVAQVYLGAVDWGPSREVLRRRVDWMADQVCGPSVLDVGCSEGILELLLARRGLDVTGVDVNAEALDFARELLANEPEETQARVRLIHGDFIRSRPVTGQFDTVILGEILEHLNDPAELLDRSLERLRPGGRIVITTPLGLLPHEDHRQTFRLTDVIEMLRSRLGLERLSVEDGYIRFIGSLQAEREASWQCLDQDAVTEMTEEALITSQTSLHGRIASLKNHAGQLNGRVREVLDRAMNLQDRIQELERQIEFEKMASNRLKKNLATKTGEARVLRHRLQSTRSSTSFLAGSELVNAAKRPRLMFGLPFRLFKLYRAGSKPSSQTPISDEPQPTHPDSPGDPEIDVSQFISYPRMRIPEAAVDGRPMAAILDTFTEHSLRYEANLLLLSRRRWRDQMEEASPACLFVESAFSGNNGEWRHQIVDYDPSVASSLRDLLEYCRTKGIPTIFWNKEDPPHFDDFIGAAKEFDFVFTSDADCLPIYREELNHDRIFVLPFAAQPRLHNPSREEDWPRYPVCFAGSWLQHRYPERGAALQFLLDPALPLGLHIFDRNLDRVEFGPNYRFPDRYRESIKGSLNYQEMLTAYRCYDVMLNVNTVANSPTMFARRVFESLACGTPVISSESVGMSNMLGGHARVSRSREDTVDHLLDLLGDEEARIREGHLAYRHVHENHTYRHRMTEVFRRVGLDSLVSKQPTVSVLMPTMRPENVPQCLKNFTKQVYAQKELILILNNAEFDLDGIRRDIEGIPNVEVLYIDGAATLGECLNRGVEVASGEYVAKMDDDDHYGERYLSDSALAATFSNAEVVGKGSFFMYFEESNTTALAELTAEHTFTHFVTGGTLFIRSDVIKDIPFEAVSLKEDTNFQRAAAQAGCEIYSGDRFNFVRVRTRRLADHADQTPDSEFLRLCRDRTPGLDLSRVMI